MTRIPAFICDVDGTLTNHTGIRGHHEYEKVLLDKPIMPIINLVNRLRQNYSERHVKLEVLFVTGRPDRDNVKSDTCKWMYDNGLVPIETKIPYKLLMRPGFLADGKHDYRPDYIVKEEIYHKDIEPYYDVQFAIDDRPQVLRMWQTLNIPTLAVGTPWKEF